MLKYYNCKNIREKKKLLFIYTLIEREYSKSNSLAFEHSLLVFEQKYASRFFGDVSVDTFFIVGIL